MNKNYITEYWGKIGVYTTIIFTIFGVLLGWKLTNMTIEDFEKNTKLNKVNNAISALD
jgi:hypothetical protein